MYELAHIIKDIYFVICSGCGQSMYVTEERFLCGEPMQCCVCEKVDHFPKLVKHND